MVKKYSVDVAHIEKSVAEYTAVRATYEDFSGKLKGLIEALLDQSNIQFQVVEHRTKTVESFREKITRANKNYSDPLREIKDLAGLRIIAYYSEDVESMCKLFENEFEIDTQNSVDKGKLLQPNEFGYRSIHYIAVLPVQRRELLEWIRFAGLSFEIQIRTVVQHAWAAISHALDYKSDEDVPSQFKRKLSRLSGLLELADEEFSELKRQQEQFTKDVSNDIVSGNTALEINTISLREYFESGAIQFLTTIGQEVGFDAVAEPDETYSRIVAACQKAKIATIGELDAVLKASEPWAREYLQLQYVNSGYGIWRVSTPFLAELILLRTHREVLDSTFLTRLGWHGEVALRVAGLAKRAL